MTDKKEYSMTVKLTWSNDTGRFWLNIDSLKLLLFSEMASKPELIDIEVLEETSGASK